MRYWKAANFSLQVNYGLVIQTTLYIQSRFNSLKALRC